MMFSDGFPVLFFTVSDCRTVSTGTKMVIFSRDISAVSQCLTMMFICLH